MSGNSFGKIFRITTFGESHGIGIGVVIDGCPAGLELSIEEIQSALDRRRPGQSVITTQRNEADKAEILSGVFEGKSTGAPIAIFIRNKDHQSVDYDALKDVFRPSHGDFTWFNKYRHRDHRGGGRLSARETATRVAAGAVAYQFIKHYGIETFAFVSQIYDIQLSEIPLHITRQEIDANMVRCPDSVVAKKMEKLILETKESGDSLGGVITCIIKNVPIGLGEPVFEKLEAVLAQAMMSINAVKGFEIGSGFSSVTMRGSEHNDAFYQEDKQIKTRTNFSGGIQGGISNGQDIVMRIAFKPVATISSPQETVDVSGKNITLEAKGRHDPCVVPRAVPIVEAMANLVIADFMLRMRGDRVG